MSPSSDRLGAQRGEVGAGARLREAAAPEILGGEDARREALLLLLGAVGEDRRADDADAEVVDDLRRVGAGHLLDVGDLLGDRGAAPAVLGRPGDRHPAVGGERRLPGAQRGDALGLGQLRDALAAQVVGEMGGEPAAQLAAELGNGLGAHARRS